MRVLLLRPFSPLFTKPYFTVRPPFGLGYLSSFLKKNGHQVKIIDLALNNNVRFLKSALKMFSPSLVGITAYTPNVLDGFETARMVKSIDNKFITVMGGSHSTSMPEDTLASCQELDYVVIGEGEITLLDLCNCLENGTDPGSVAGLSYRRDGKIKRSPFRGLIDQLDSLPFPDRDSTDYLYRNLIFDHNLNLSINKVLEVTTSRGCSDSCTFCTVHRAYLEKGRSLRLRSAENVLAEIDFFREKFRIKHVSFLDDSFTIQRERVKKIMFGLKDRRLSWNCDTRVNLVDRQLILEMAETGCKKISVGVESGSERILSLIKKNITVNQIREFFKWCREANLETVEANFMIGSHPDETAEDVNKTRILIKELKPQRAVVSIIVPFPGTEVRDQMLRRRLIFSDDWRKYTLMNNEPPPWRTTFFTSSELKMLQNAILVEFYFNLKNIITNLKYVSSPAKLKVYLLSGLEIIKDYLINKLKQTP